MVSELFVDVVFFEEFGGGVDGFGELSGEGLFFFFDDGSEFVGPDAGDGVGGVELEVVEFAECGFGLCRVGVGEVEGAVADCAFDAYGEAE